MLKIIPTSERPLSKEEIIRAHNILYVAYKNTEEEIWGKNYDRLFIEDFTKLIEEGDIYIAYWDDKIVGLVHLYAKDKETYKFGLLSTDFDYGGQGIGSALIKRAEEETIKNKAKQVKIEILRVKDREIPHKLRLANYYKRLGYQFTHTEDCSCIIPDWKYKLLIAPSSFDFYCKVL
jgi:GNAT superfamily N-acetyltransferase